MRYTFVLLYLALFSYSSFAQDQAKVDSLLLVCKESTTDTAHVMALKALAWQYYYPQPKTAYNYAYEMLELASKSKFIKGQWDAYNILGVLNYGQSRFDTANVWFKKAVNLSSSRKYFPERIYSLNWSGHSYRLMAQYKEADSCFNLGLKSAERKNDNINMAKANKSLGINNYSQGKYLVALQHYLKADSLFGDYMHYERAETLQNIGLIYHIMENLDAERDYYTQAQKLYEDLGDAYGANAIYRSLGSTELKAGNYKGAIDYWLRSLSYFEKNNDLLMLGTIKKNLGNAYLKLKDYESAKLYLESSIAIINGIEGTSAPSNTYRHLGDVYMELDQATKALEAYTKAVKYAENGGLDTGVLALESQGNAYYKLKEYQKAFDVKKQQQFLSDSLNDIKSSETIHEIEAKYQSEKKEQEIKLLTTQNELAKKEKREQLYLLVSVIGLALILAIVFYILYLNRQKTTRRLKELDMIKSNFFANISHEFRTPLTLIKGPVEGQLTHQNLNDQERTNLQMIDRNADRLLDLVDQLLDLSKLEAGKMELNVSEGSLPSFVKALAPSFEYAAEQKSISYRSEISSDSDLSWFDKDILNKVVTNLLSNAVKYTIEGGEIGFSVMVSAGKALISVKNTGGGVIQEDIKKVFERFYQADNTKEGVGIGLALVKELVELHKGKINLKSTNGWTEFIVSIPIEKSSFNKEELQPAEHELQPEKSRLTSGITGQPTMVEDPNIADDSPILLVVDDNTDVRTLVKDIFKDSFTIVEALDGDDGIKKAIEHIPDVIISDIMMPIKDGVELSQTLKTDERTCHIPIILLTAKAGEENELIGLETGADDYVTKPFGTELLKVRVNKLIALRARLRQRYSQEVVLRPKDIAISSTDEKFLGRVQRLLDQKLTDSDFNAQLFSKEVGMSRMQLHRKLKALVGLTTTEFIRSQRLKLAAHLLESADINMSEVGYTVGFNDPSYFAKCFKETYGCTPTDYAATNFKDS